MVFILDIIPWLLVGMASGICCFGACYFRAECDRERVDRRLRLENHLLSCRSHAERKEQRRLREFERQIRKEDKEDLAGEEIKKKFDARKQRWTDWFEEKLIRDPAPEWLEPMIEQAEEQYKQKLIFEAEERIREQAEAERLAQELMEQEQLERERLERGEPLDDGGGEQEDGAKQDGQQEDGTKQDGEQEYGEQQDGVQRTDEGEKAHHETENKLDQVETYNNAPEKKDDPKPPTLPPTREPTPPPSDEEDDEQAKAAAMAYPRRKRRSF